MGPSGGSECVGVDGRHYGSWAAILSWCPSGRFAAKCFCGVSSGLAGRSEWTARDGLAPRRAAICTGVTPMEMRFWVFLTGRNGGGRTLPGSEAICSSAGLRRQERAEPCVAVARDSVEMEPTPESGGEAPLSSPAWFYSGCLRRLATMTKRRAAAMMAHTSRTVELSIVFLL